jgi:Domain of unknown function (DUF5664)
MKVKKILEKLGIISDEFDEMLEEGQLSSTKEEREAVEIYWTTFQEEQATPEVAEDTSSKGMKYDSGKLRYTLLPFKALTEVVKVLEFGAKKYKEESWKTVPNARKRYLDAAFRHLVDYLDGKKVDEESSLPTLAHAVCDLLFILWLDLTSKE